MRTLISMVPLLSGCLLTGEQYDIKYEEMFPDAVEADTADSPEVTLQSVTLSSDNMFTNSILTATAEAINASDEAVDITDQQVTFEWHVIDADTNQDTVVQTDESNTLDGTLYFDKDDQVYAVATFGAVSVTSDTILVYNSPPTTPSINITPSSPVAGLDDVSCNVNVESTDADNDPVTYNYEWLDSTGETIQRSNGVAELSDVLSAELTTAGPLTCSVTPLSVDYVGISEFAIVDVGANEGVCTSLYFNGNDHYLEVPASDNLIVGNEFTFESWLFWEGTHGAQYQIPFSYGLADSIVFRLHILDQASDCGGNSGQFLLSWDTLGLSNCTASNDAVPVNQWVHVAVVYTGSQFELYVDGQLQTSKSENSIPDGSSLEFYMGSMPDNLDDNEYDFHGHIAMAHLTDEVLYTTDFTPSLSPSASNSTFLFDFGQGEHQNQIDETGNFTYSINGDVVWADTCPQEDLDGDGFVAWEDCDDSNPNVQTERPVISCFGNQIITVPADQRLDFGTSDHFTVDFWAYYTAESQTTLVKGSSGEYTISGNASEITFARQSYGSDLFVTDTRMTEVWTRYTVSYDAGNVQWYRNGAPTSSGSGILGVPSYSDLNICNHPNLTDPMNGYLAHLTFFDDVLSQETVAGMFDGSIDPLTDVPSILAHWPMNEGGGTTINDTVSQMNGEMDGAGWSTGCLPEPTVIDNDGDGVESWEDCDDDDSSVTFECLEDCLNYDTYTFTGTEQYWTKNYSKVFVKAWGAGGGTNNYTATGGGGGYAEALLDVPGTGLTVVVGEGGSSSCSPYGSCTTPPVYAGGGEGTSSHGSGGGYSGVFDGSVSQPNALLIAGGGGGGGDTVNGGAGGGEYGQNSSAGAGGEGGSQTQGGNSGTLYGGSALQGGSTDEVSGGGGGGGYFGGGGGTSTNPRGEGGGGSGFDSTGLGVLTGGSYVNPGNENDPLRTGYGDGGTPSNTNGSHGGVIICHP